MNAANSVTTVATVSTATLTAPIDYVITSNSTDNAITGSLDIANNCAVVIFENIKPYTLSQSNLLSKITINGAAAKTGTNCRITMHRHGTILFPYCNANNPLTVYDSNGEAKSSWDVWTWYKELGTWDNAITRFTLKRGYMVTMANHADGTGYSHCFIAQDEDLEVTLPAAMQKSVSFLRIFEWGYPGKKGLAGHNTTALGNLNLSWFYDWDANNYRYQNYDYTPQRHHETGNTNSGEYKWQWPEWNKINTNNACHVLGMNEPDNTSGAEVYMTPEDMFKHHKEYLASGMRIGTFACCNPNDDWVKRYVDLCRNNNMRIDFVATHYYIGGSSASDFKSRLESLHNAASGLPVWVTEWNNGANWTTEIGFTTSEGWYIWGSGDDHYNNGLWFRDCLTEADKHTWIERLAIYNDVEYKRYLYYTDSNWPTPGGELVRDYNSKLAYSASNEIWMPWNSSAPKNLKAEKNNGTVTLEWQNPNTDCTKEVWVQERHTTDGSTTWQTIATLGVSDSETRSCSIDYTLLTGDQVVRIANQDHDNTERISNIAIIDDPNAPEGFSTLTYLPTDALDEYYYMFYSHRASVPLCLGLQDLNGTKTIFYQTPKEPGADLAQIWQIETSDKYGGYGLRNLSDHDYMIRHAPNVWNCNSAETHTGDGQTGWRIWASEDYFFLLQNDVSTGNYMGLWDNDNNFVDGKRVAGNRSWNEKDTYVIYAIKKKDFNEKHLVGHRHTDCNYLIDNASFTWGTSSISVQGSGGANNYPARWNFQRSFSGWNDTKIVDATFSDGTNGKALNVWAGTVKYAELSYAVNNLPNGIYRLKADMTTTDGSSRLMTKTAIYADPDNQDYIARSYNVIGAGNDTYRTYEVYAVVDKGTLNIGVRTDASWFKIGNVRLEYVCQASEANEEVWGKVDNGRALQKQCWLMDNLFVDLAEFTRCRNLQIDQSQPNAIVSMASTATVDETYNTHNIVLGGTCANLVLTDGQAYESPVEFTALKASCERQMENTWGTIMLPYAVQSTADIQYYQLCHVDTERGSMSFEPVITMPANTPGVFVRQNTTPVLDFSSSDVSVQPLNDAGSSTPVSGWTLHGTYKGIALDTDASEDDVYFISDDQYRHATGSLTINPFRAYFTTAKGNNVRSFRLVADNGTEDGLTLVTDSQTGQDAYTVSGIRMPQCETKARGLYIINRRKAVISGIKSR